MSKNKNTQTFTISIEDFLFENPENVKKIVEEIENKKGEIEKIQKENDKGTKDQVIENIQNEIKQLESKIFANPTKSHLYLAASIKNLLKSINFPEGTADINKDSDAEIINRTVSNLYYSMTDKYTDIGTAFIKYVRKKSTEGLGFDYKVLDYNSKQVFPLSATKGENAYQILWADGRPTSDEESLKKANEEYFAKCGDKSKSTSSDLSYVALDIGNDSKVLMIHFLLSYVYEKYGIEKIKELCGTHIQYTVNSPFDNKLDAAFGTGSKQIVFTGAPGTGKTYGVQKYIEKKIEEEGDQSKNKFRFQRVQFHSSYDYTDFIEGIRPVEIIKNSKKTDNSETSDKNTEERETAFVKLDGIFKAFCRKIVEEEIEDKCYFMIDEINRADLSKVFGELMYSLEESNRGKDHKIPTQYANLPTYTINENGFAERIEKKDDVFADGFYIPDNVYIIGTMNDIDKSVESFDFALRRRFQWAEINAKDSMLSVLDGIFYSKLEDKDDSFQYKALQVIADLYERMNALNEVICSSENDSKGKNSPKFGLTEAYHIGAAYLKHLDIIDGRSVVSKTKLAERLKTVWDNNIEPILREYTRGYNSSVVKTFIDDCKNAFMKQNPKGKKTNGEQGGQES